jgi:phage-related protein
LRLDAITDFLDDHRGGESFNWLPPRASAPVRVICEAQRSGTFNTLRYGSMRVTFRQVPA